MRLLNDKTVFTPFLFICLYVVLFINNWFVTDLLRRYRRSLGWRDVGGGGESIDESLDKCNRLLNFRSASMTNSIIGLRCVIGNLTFCHSLFQLSSCSAADILPNHEAIIRQIVVCGCVDKVKVGKRKQVLLRWKVYLKGKTVKFY